MGHYSWSLERTVNDNTLHPAHESLVVCIMSRYALNLGQLIETKIGDRALNEKAGLPFLCLIQRLHEHAGVLISHFLDRRTTVSKSTNISLIKDAGNPLYKVKTSRAAIQMTITPGLPPIILSLEGASTSTPTGEASEHPKGEIQPPPSTSVGIGMLVTVSYEFLSRLVDD